MDDANRKLNTTVLKGIQLMCRVFWGPNLELCQQIKDYNCFQTFKIISKISKCKSSINLNDIDSVINSFDTYEALFDQLNECYVRLFVNSKEGITSPLYESCYEFENAPMMGKSAVRMAQRFTSKGLSMEKAVHEPPDHLAIELEYLFFLLQENNDSISSEAASFAEETMIPWVTAFNQRLESVDDDCKFYFFASTILIQMLDLISNRK